MGKALVLRRTVDGLRVVGEPPAEHVLTGAFLARELAAGTVTVTVELATTSGPVVYQVTGPELNDGDPDRPDLSAWRVALRYGEDS